MVDNVRLAGRWAKKSVLSVSKSLGAWVGVLVVGVIFLGVFLSIAHWGWLQGGTNRTGNSAVVRNIALVIGGVVAIVAIMRKLIILANVLLRGMRPWSDAAPDAT